MTRAATTSVGVGQLAASRPAVPAALLLAAGVAAHSAVPHSPPLWLAAMAGAIAFAAFVQRRPLASSAALAGAILFGGVAAAQLSAFYFPRNHVSAFATDSPRLAQIELHLDHPPRILTGPYAGTHHALPPKQVAMARVTALKTWDGWAKVEGEVLVQIADPHPRLAVNQTVRMVGMLQRPAPAMNPGQFDWAEYYREQRVLNSLHVSHAGNVEILDSPAPGPVQFLRAEVRRALAAGFPAGESLDHALLRALLLGDHDPQLRDVQDQFKRTGTGHHLAISGMHVAVLGGFVYGICRLLCLPPRGSAWAMMAFVVLYGVVALPSPPVVRSVLLCLAFGVGLVGHRSVDALQLLALTVLAMLVYHPLDLFNPGFQLSFGTVLGLILFTRPMLRWMRRDPDVLDASRPRQHSSLVDVAADSGDRALVRALAAGVVAWGVSLPLIAFHFEQLNPWAVVAGIALAPLVMAALVAGLLKIVLTLLWPGASPAWAAMAAAPVAGMRRMVDWLSALPMGDVPVPPPPVWLMLLFYVMLLPALRPCRRAGIRWCLRGGRAVVLLLILLLPFQVGFTGKSSIGAGETRVTLLAVGAGQCAVVEPPSGRVILIDAGSTGMADVVSRCLGPFLRHRRHTSVDTVVVSHANYDHFSAVAEVVESYGVREVLTSAQFAEHAAGSPAAEAMLASLADAQRPPRVVSPGERLPLGRETYLEVLWPPKDLHGTYAPNDASLVLKLTHAGGSVLFTGDVQDAAMRELLREPHRLRADVLVAPHHGSAEPSTARFVAAVAPRFVVSSNDRSLTSKQRAMDRLVGRVPLLRTHDCGAIRVQFDEAGGVTVQGVRRR